MLSAYNVTKAFGGTRIIEDVSLAVRRGEAVGLLGPSGAGKTTVFSTLIGITVPDAGQIILDEVDITPDVVSPARWHDAQVPVGTRLHREPNRPQQASHLVRSDAVA